MSDCQNCDPQPGPGSHDPRANAVPAANDSLGPVLGPYLGGGFSGSHLGSGVTRVGGGLTPPVLRVGLPYYGDYPSIRHDFRFDYSTPGMIFVSDTDPPLNREFGGMLGGGEW